MAPRSIRWRLPITYAGIAMLAVLLLGVVLLLTLRGYYLKRESDYILSNADAIGSELSLVVEHDMEADTLQSYVGALAFLAQARVRFLGPDGAALADSGYPQGLAGVASLSLDLQLGGMTRVFKRTVSGGEGEEERSSQIAFETGSADSPTGRTRVAQSVVVSGGQPGPAETSGAAPSGPGPGLGFDLGPPPETPRSGKVVTVPVRDDLAELLGYVEVSEGPAFGRDVLGSVARAWAVAGVVAVMVAAGAGWLVSRRLTRPILHLAEVAGRMAQGDLSVRAHVDRDDELGQLAVTYNHMAGRVEDTVLTLRRFVGDAAHQLLTPLTALRTNLGLQDRQLEGGQGESFVARAQAQLDRLEALSKGLLDLSRLEADADGEERTRFDLDLVLGELSEQFASQAEQAGIDFALGRPAGRVPVLGSENQMRQAVGNLLDNALKFTPAGGAVQVSLRSEGGWASLAIEDTGIGIPETDLDYLFERFHRGGNSSRFPGSGLGLTIVQAIAAAHGGDISAESQPQGSRFVLRVPLAG